MYRFFYENYFLRDAVWHNTAFILLYKKNKMNTNIKKNENQYTTSMVLESCLAAFSKENLKSINSSFIKEFVKNKDLLAKKETYSELGESKPLFIGFAVASDSNRAKKAIELALSTPLLNDKIIENTKTILLLISSDVIEMNLTEIGEINDSIREKVGDSADIIMVVSEDKNLGKSLSITIMLSGFDASGNRALKKISTPELDLFPKFLSVMGGRNQIE